MEHLRGRGMKDCENDRSDRDSELLKSFCSDIQDNLEILQTLSYPKQCDEEWSPT